MLTKTQIFISHTKKDVRFCDLIDKLFARVPIRAFRSEYENIQRPQWQTIKSAMNDSMALFLLVGQALVNNQKLKNAEWSYTQNWIAYEIGLACQLGIDVWAICDDVMINFPMPYINNYYPMKLFSVTRIRPAIGFKKDPSYIYLKHIIDTYSSGNHFPFQKNLTGMSIGITCKYCGAQFNLHQVGRHPMPVIKCPQCLKMTLVRKAV